MLEIFLHQLHDHLKSLRFQLSLVLLIAFFAANGLVYGWKAERLVDEVGRVEAESARRFDGVSDPGGLLGTGYRVHMRPLETGFMVEGGQDWSSDTVYLSAASGQGLAVTGRVVAVNHWMDRFEIVDWALIVRIAVSFLAIALAYDTLSGERERGTLAHAAHPSDLPGPHPRRQARRPPRRAAGRRARERGHEPRHPGAAGRPAARVSNCWPPWPCSSWAPSATPPSSCCWPWPSRPGPALRPPPW